MEWVRDDGYWVTDDQRHLDLDRVHRWLSEESYWAAGRSMEVVARSLDASVIFGCFAADGTQAGVCRWVTDGVSFAWLCDVFVDVDRRGQGLGQFLVQSAMTHPSVSGLGLLLLATRDAHHLYSRFGFAEVAPGRFMELRR
ncbi:MAG: GNAT family N-acetyltransferase [Acidimicrobiales bacterium]